MLMLMLMPMQQHVSEHTRVLLGTLRYFLVLGVISWSFEVLPGTSGYFDVRLAPSSHQGELGASGVDLRLLSCSGVFDREYKQRV